MQLGPLQTAWVEALESGRFKQTTDALCINGCYCCLGVACEVAIAGGVPVMKEGSGDGDCTFDGAEDTLPNSVRATMKFTDEFGGISGDVGIDVVLNTDDSETVVRKTALTEANDAGATFADIAAFVRANPEAVFSGPA